MNTLQNSITQLSDYESLRYFCRQQEENHPMPSTDVIKEIVKTLRAIFYPGYFGDANVNPENVSEHIEKNIYQLHQLLVQQIKSGICFTNENQDYKCPKLEEKAVKMSNEFIAQLPELRDVLHTDIIAVYNGDPAAKSYGEVIFCYPTIKAITNYRIAHALLKLEVPIIPRVITELAHSETGIDIHPGATIGKYFMIDHGTGVVIGETSIIGDNVRMYQGVTLGAKSFPLDEKGNPIKGIDRHPKIGNNVIIYSNSTILGNIKVGDGAIIGGNLWVDTDVPAGAILSQKKRNEELEKEKHKSKKKEKKHKDIEEKKYSFLGISEKRAIPPFKPCKDCNSKYGCKKCREKYEKKYGVKIDNKTIGK
ncbi:Serine acetyltransferase, plasmid (modular protein) [uncultured Paludibacter sp.]|uniref:serine O-acetyltransferase n=1 Tax=uncultured Paludibacter sp. TaxID=497635 RepID=A0A653AC28_9BACT|nr:Serine acetyltransferase, plasmid (modular protein) [uncultured Paludibacter sp.]